MEASLYNKLKEKQVQCYACSHRCKIKEDSSGVCGVRKNIGGKLDLLVYGKPCAVWVDPIEKKPLNHFLPGTRSYSIGTYGCNFSCDFCQNWEISQAPKEFRDNFENMVKQCPDLPPEEAVKQAKETNCSSIAYTYTEPTIFSEYAHDIGILAKKEGMKNIFVTNGYETKECWDYLAEFLDAVNIDLKGTDDFYKRICHVEGWQPVLDSIKYAKEKGIWTEVTTLIVPGENDNPEFYKYVADYLHSIDPEMPWHITAFYPHYKMKDKKSTPLESLIEARKIGKKAGLKHIYIGNILGEESDTVCPECGKTVIKRSGFALTEKNISDGKCNFCGRKINGVWK
ncbi:AmmeMemoRadiSam system radical SAM enzyme [Candidatus Micrarchaeota archaeon]|nr:AmmeMemoRadiSam system radical SAM enzyme [Candidatus Micrarchaeota archaeon]